MTIYCTRADVESIWTPAAVLVAVDDDENGSLSPAEEALIDDAIQRGAGQLNAILEQRYTLANLADNAWCRDANAIFAAYLLAARRSETLPVGLGVVFAWYRNTLDEIGRGRLKVPLANETHDHLPTATNFSSP